jgi:phytoene synthase
MAELAGEGRAMLAEAGGRLPRGVMAAALPAVLARRDLARGNPDAVAAGRGIGDRLAVVAAWARARV